MKRCSLRIELGASDSQEFDGYDVWLAETLPGGASPGGYDSKLNSRVSCHWRGVKGFLETLLLDRARAELAGLDDFEHDQGLVSAASNGESLYR